MLTVATVNVNGIRAAVRRGMPAWLAGREPDVLCLQELRAPLELTRELLGEGWHGVHEEGTAAGRAGVAVFSRVPPAAVRIGLAGDFDGAGRWVEADLETPAGPVTAVSTYVFTGEAGTPRQEEKHRFLDAMAARMAELAAGGGRAVVCGDLNIAHREEDLRNWKGNRGKSGFLPEERTWIDRLLAAGWGDVTRRLSGEGPGPYSWWSWRGQAFDNDTGWRIDYQLASPALDPHAVKAEIDRAPSYAERWSDHAPVVVAYDL